MSSGLGVLNLDFGTLDLGVVEFGAGSLGIVEVLVLHKGVATLESDFADGSKLVERLAEISLVASSVDTPNVELGSDLGLLRCARPV